ncbi:hypothetical protein G6F63_014120 [Rhizopus arrhizus]|nr:hypothetical protein G6F63_014120 [Rhizopus arrhizus]
MAAERLLECPALGPLVVHFTGARNLAAVAGRAFVGKHHLVHALQQRGQHHDRRVHRRDRDMTGPGALAVECEQVRRQRAAQVQRRQAGTLGTGADQLRTPDQGHGVVHAGTAQRFDAVQRILAAANGHQRMRLQAQHWRLHRFALHWQAETPAQVQAVAVGEFAQAV